MDDFIKTQDELIENEKSAMHYGTKRHSGRYPWGSGQDPYQHSGDWISRVYELEKEGMSAVDISKYFGISTTELRTYKSVARNERRAADYVKATRLKEEGMSNTEIAKELGYPNESSVRSLFNTQSAARMNAARNTAEFLKKEIDEKGYLDVGSGVESELHISKEKMREALTILEAEGYPVMGVGVQQVTNPGQQTNLKVLCKPGTSYKELYDNVDNIKSVEDYISYDDGETFKKSFVYPESLDSSRLQIRYAEEGGLSKDGTIELRRGVDDISLGESNYAQVRIMVDGTHYLKGMALYNDNMPDGVDVIFNTNKKVGTPMEKVLKEIKDDPDNPFGSLIKEHGGQSYYIDKETGEEKLSLINKRADEGDWSEWKDALPSQFLAKQNISLVKQQLDISKQDKLDEFNSIMALENPTIKRQLLETFASDCDSAAVHLKAAALPRQKYQVILPIDSMKDDEVYAPNYANGEQVALIRYPHGGTFEIPILTVNNKQAEAKNKLGPNVTDVVGINSKVAERLSGADFDGDTVMVIPTNDRVRITSTPPLKGLEGFDPKMSYPAVPGMKYMKVEKNGKVISDATQSEMGKISNLIMDMTLKGAKPEELARAVRHSMVVIDAGKHKLNYKLSEEENNIKELKQIYQAHTDDPKYGGAGTLITRAKSKEVVAKRHGNPWINAETGELEWEKTDPKTGKHYSKQEPEYYTTKEGKVKQRTQDSTKMAETKDARTLISEFNTPVEREYADYANSMKALANQARKEMVSTGRLKYNSSARKEYIDVVKDLESQLLLAEKNAPRERQAQIMAQSHVKSKVQSNPNMTKADIKKAKQQALTNARNKVSAKRHEVVIDDRAWEAIQKGAISDNTLSKILKHTDKDKLRERATPRASKNTISQAQISRANNMASLGYTNAEIAKKLGISTTSVTKILKGGV